ncbi:VWA domain-containing protein [Acidobacteriota bacterium]
MRTPYACLFLMPSRAIGIFFTVFFIAGLAAMPVVSQSPVMCDTVSNDGKTTLEIHILSPAPGTVVTEFAPCPSEVEVNGIASTIGIPVEIEVYIIVDSSGSTAAASGVDVDEDNFLGTGNPSTDPDDSILAAEIEAVRQFVGTLDPAAARIAIIQFSNPEGALNVGERQRIVQSLTHDFTLVEAALDDIFNAVPNSAGATDYGGALDLLISEFTNNHLTGAHPVALYMSDGVPTWPKYPWNVEDPEDRQEALDGAADCRDLGITIHSFGIGTIFFPLSSDTLEQVALITGGKYYDLLYPSEILDILPGASLVGIKSVEVENVTLPITVPVDIRPDGSFTVLVPIGQGLNEIEVHAIADNDEETSLDCQTDYTLECLVPAECFGVNRLNLICGIGGGTDEDEDNDLRPGAKGSDEDSDTDPVETFCPDPVNIEVEGSFLFNDATVITSNDRVTITLAEVTLVDAILGEFQKHSRMEIYTLRWKGAQKGRVVLDFDRCRFSVKLTGIELGDLDPAYPVTFTLRIGTDIGFEDIQLGGDGTLSLLRSGTHP